MARKLLLIAFAILLLPLVFALSEDFSANAPAEVPVFFCAPASSQFTVSNTGSVASVYSILLSGDAALYAAVDFPQFSLQPGQTATLTTSFNTPCDLRGSQDLVTTVRTSFGLESSFTQKVVSFTPDNIDVTMTPQDHTMGPCEVSTFDLTLNNPINYQETYRLSLANLPFATISEDEVTLAPGESKDISIRAEPLDCTMHGEFPFQVTIDTATSQIQESLSGSVTVEPNFIPQISLERTKFTNYYEEQWIPVQIENIGEPAAIYDVEITGASFASPEPQNVRVEGKSTETINVKLLPFNDSAQGTYDIAVKLTVVATGNVYQAAPFTVDLKPHNAFTWFYASYTILFWVIVVAVIILLIAIVLLITYLSLPSTKEKRAIKKIERAKRKAEKKKAKLAKKAAKAKKKEEKKKAKLAKKEAKRKAKADKKAAKLKAKKDAKAKKLAAAKAKQKAKADAAKTARQEKQAMIKAVKQEYFLISKKDEGFKPLPLWKKLVVGLVLILAIVALAAALWIFWAVLSPFLIAILIGAIIVLLIVIILLWWRYRSIGYFTRREIKLREREKAAKEKLAVERQKAKDAIKAEKARLAEEKRKAKEKRAQEKAKKAKVKEQSSRDATKQKAATANKPRSYKLLGWLSTLAVLAIIIVLGIVFWSFVVAFWPAVLVGVIIAALIALIIKRYAKNHIRKSWPFAKGWVFVRTKWSKGLGEIRFKLDKIGEDVRVKINRSRRKDVFVVPGAKVYQYFNFDVHANFTSLKASFRVKKKWLKRYDVKLMQFVRGSWNEIKTKMVSEDKRYAYFQNALESTGQFAIVGMKKQAPRRRWWPWFLLIAILLLLLGFTFGLVGQASTPDFNGIPPQNWLQDSVHVINLNEFFNDPDGDKLAFTATPVQNINIFIDGDGNAVLTPDTGFVGERGVIFTATDKDNQQVRSNRVQLTVAQSPVPVQALPWIKWGLIGVLILVLLIVLVRFRNSLLAYISE